MFAHMPSVQSSICGTSASPASGGLEAHAAVLELVSRQVRDVRVVVSSQVWRVRSSYAHVPYSSSSRTIARPYETGVRRADYARYNGAHGQRVTGPVRLVSDVRL